MEGEPEEEGYREYREELNQEVAKLGETTEKIFRGAQLQRLAVLAGIAGSQNRQRILAGGRKDNV